jgi:hypothetical protein
LPIGKAESSGGALGNLCLSGRYADEPLLQFSVRCRQAQNDVDQHGQSAKVVEERRAVFIFRRDMRTGQRCISASDGKHKWMLTGFVSRPNLTKWHGAICVFPEDIQLSLCGISSPDVGKQKRALINTAECTGGTALFFGDRFVCPRACNLKIRTRPYSYIAC